MGLNIIHIRNLLIIHRIISSRIWVIIIKVVMEIRGRQQLHKWAYHLINLKGKLQHQVQQIQANLNL